MYQLIHSTNLSRAHLMDFFEVMRMVSKFLSEEDLPTLKLEKEADIFRENLNALDKALLQAQKTGFTDQILSLDQKRDDILTGFNFIVRGLMYYPDPLVLERASVIKNIMDKYGARIQQLPQREESAVIINMLQDFNSPEYFDNIQKLNLVDWIRALENTNNEFESLYLARSEKEAKFITGLTREQRDKMQDSFTHLCHAIEAYAFIGKEELYQPLADKINVEVAKVKQLAKAREERHQNQQKEDKE